MFSIKQSFADCSTCKLLDAPSCITETNSDNDLSKVDIIFIAMNPGKTEVEKQVPLCGKSGKIFRKYFDKFIKNNFNWLLTNVVLCSTINPDGTTGSPDDQTAEKCKVNTFEFIKQCNPKLIVLMGGKAKDCFDISGSITDIRGEIFQWNNYNILPTIHPSFLGRKPDQQMEMKFAEDFKKAAKLMGINIEDKVDEFNSSQKLGKGIHYYKLSDPKFYEENYALLDVQYLHSLNQVLYIFKDKDGNKIYHKENDDFICYQIDDKNKAKKLVSHEELNQIKIPYNKRDTLDHEKTYESDVNIQTKHAQDYYLQSKGEPEVSINTLFTDIEVYNEGKDFPVAEEANYPITMITDYFKDKYKVYLLDLHNKDLKNIVTDDYENVEIEIFNNEKKLIQAWINNLKKSDPDVLSGFNLIPFDITYLITRARKFNINQDKFSRFGDVYLDGFRWTCDIPGTIVLDELALYREFTFTKLESYSLESIAQHELDHGKTEKATGFAKLFNEDINKAIKYNIVDVQLLVELDNKLQHIFLLNELRRICGCDFKASKSQLGRIDSILIMSGKKKGLACKDANVKEKGSKYEGAYVHPPITGLHNYLVDFDFKSLYPSLILTYNIGINTLVYKLEDPHLGYELCYHPEQLPQEVNLIIDPAFENKVEKISKDELIQKIKDEDLISMISGCLYKKHELERSFYAEILEVLLDSRDNYKKMMYNAEDKSIQTLYDTKQQVYKILANAMYGVLGNNVFRFFNLDLARSITLNGQEAIKQAIMKGNEYISCLNNKEQYTNELFDFKKNDMFVNELSYKTPYIITGDTDSIFASYEDLVDTSKDMDSITQDMDQISNDLQNYLNSKVISNVVSNHNINLEYNRLRLKNELVINRGLFLTKKRYALHVIKKEGNEIDKINNMGLDTKRSDYPSYTKECLEQLLDMLLRSSSYSINNILDYVKSKEKEFKKLINNKDKKIARPASFGRKLEDYKSIPQGVNGMLNWNKLLYNVFDVGSKGYLFKLNGIDLELAPEDVQIKYEQNFVEKNRKLDVIVVPEEDDLPEYLIPNAKDMLKFSWIDRYNLLLEPILKGNFKEQDVELF